jgi:DNA repair protein RadC
MSDAPQRIGFSEEALRGLEDLERRLPPMGLPAADPAWAEPTSTPVPTTGAHRERLRQRFSPAATRRCPSTSCWSWVLFNAIPRIDVKPLAKTLLATFGDLNGVIAAPEARLMSVPGVTDKVHLQLKVLEAVAHRMARAKVMQREVIGSWDALMRYCKTVMAYRDTERFRILFLDRKNVLIADEELAKGTVDHVPVYPREVAKRALELNASALILVHNHPSGDPTPSRADVEMTGAIALALQAIGVTLHDHVVIGKETDASFRTLGCSEAGSAGAGVGELAAVGARAQAGEVGPRRDLHPRALDRPAAGQKLRDRDEAVVRQPLGDLDDRLDGGRAVAEGIVLEGEERVVQQHDRARPRLGERSGPRGFRRHARASPRR